MALAEVEVPDNPSDGDCILRQCLPVFIQLGELPREVKLYHCTQTHLTDNLVKDVALNTLQIDCGHT